MKANYFLISFFVGILFLSSCLHKNVMNSEADDVVKVFPYEQDGHPYLITLEKIFQATSKSSGGGMTSISGYNNFRVTVYDLETGKIVARNDDKELSKGEPFDLVGVTDGNLWIYSLNKKNGLFSVDPLTLKPKVTQDQIFAVNTQISKNLATPTGYNISDFYLFDNLSQKLIITDNQGFRYAVDPKNLIAEKLSDDKKFKANYSYSYLSTNAKINGKYLQLDGDVRQCIKYDSKICNKDLNFLDGKFLIDQNIDRLYTFINQKLTEYQSELDKVSKKMDSIKTANGDKDEWDYTSDSRDYWRALDRQKYIIADKMRDFKNDMDQYGYGNISKNYLLSLDTSYFFVAQKNNTNKDAFMTITKVDVKNDTVFSSAWNTTIDNVFIDYSAAESTDAFKTVFSKGDPDFDFQYFDIFDNKLIVIYTLNMFCIDIQTGKILWKFRI